MNSSPRKPFPSDVERAPGHGAGEETLRLIAILPAPEGLTDRVKASLVSAPEAGLILMWRGPLRPAGGWIYSSFVRGAAAAAIVCVVAGGGWSIYSRVQTPVPARVIVMPPPVMPAAPGFSQSGASRVPDTIVGPVLKHPVAPVTELKMPAQSKAGPVSPVGKKKKAPSRAAAAPVQ